MNFEAPFEAFEGFEAFESENEGTFEAFEALFSESQRSLQTKGEKPHENAFGLKNEEKETRRK